MGLILTILLVIAVILKVAWNLYKRSVAKRLEEEEDERAWLAMDPEQYDRFKKGRKEEQDRMDLLRRLRTKLMIANMAKDPIAAKRIGDAIEWILKEEAGSLPPEYYDPITGQIRRERQIKLWQRL